MKKKLFLFSLFIGILTVLAALGTLAGCKKDDAAIVGGTVVVMDGNNKATITKSNKKYIIEFDAGVYPTAKLEKNSIKLVDPDKQNQTGYPTGYVFPDDMVSFTVTGLETNQTIKVRITFPTPFPPGTSFFQSTVDGFRLFVLANIIGNAVELTLQDGGEGDTDNIDGQITDPIGPVTPPQADGDVTPTRLDWGLYNDLYFPAYQASTRENPLELSWSQTLYINALKGQAWTLDCGAQFYLSQYDGVGKNSVGITPAMDAQWTRGINNTSCTYTNTSTGAVQTIAFRVIKPNGSSAPFGAFETPRTGDRLSGSIPVTGWALDDVGVKSVDIYTSGNAGTKYIGTATFAEGFRPDIDTNGSYTQYPNKHKAGWGYMMLTNYLPDGPYALYAVATNAQGESIVLGSGVSVVIDNANAVKPFGAIDTPVPGGSASGTGYTNLGWVLTPLPNSIPNDGSTISVWIDGVNKGNVTYNQPRHDIAELFPGFNNSSGPGGTYSFDTTSYANGVHTIQWTTTDNAGNNDGIGSRYFTVNNTN